MPVPPELVPPSFAARQVADRAEAGRAWLAALPGLVDAGLARWLARLNRAPAPAGLRHLREVASSMLDQVPHALPRLARDDDRRLVDACAGAVADLLPTAGDRLLHWDLHYGNVLAGQREAWLAIDPKPLAGDPGFELLPALWNRWDDVTAGGELTRSVRRRFDLMVAVLDLDRERAAGWTLGRILQNVLWDVADGAATVGPALSAVATALRSRTG